MSQLHIFSAIRPAQHQRDRHHERWTRGRSDTREALIKSSRFIFRHAGGDQVADVRVLVASPPRVGMSALRHEILGDRVAIALRILPGDRTLEVVSGTTILKSAPL